jgi:hypothetical protein
MCGWGDMGDGQVVRVAVAGSERGHVIINIVFSHTTFLLMLFH